MLFKKAVSIFVAKPVQMGISLAQVVDIQVVDAIHDLKKAGLNQNRVTLSGSIEPSESLLSLLGIDPQARFRLQLQLYFRQRGAYQRFNIVQSI